MFNIIPVYTVISTPKQISVSILNNTNVSLPPPKSSDGCLVGIIDEWFKKHEGTMSYKGIMVVNASTLIHKLLGVGQAHTHTHTFPVMFYILHFNKNVGCEVVSTWRVHIFCEKK